jgi:hypothetical protein
MPHYSPLPILNAADEVRQPVWFSDRRYVVFIDGNSKCGKSCRIACPDEIYCE